MMRRKSLLRWVLLAAIILLLAAAGLAAWWWQRGESEVIATIYVNDEVYASYDLSAITDTETFTIGEPGAQNTISVSPEGIAVIDADCPDQVCVHQGTRSHGPTPIVCLPHHLSIRFSEKNPDDDSLDAVAGQ